MTKDFFFKRYRELGESPRTEIEVRQAIRVNTLKITQDTLQEILVKKGVKLESIPSLPNGLRVLESAFSLGASLEYLLGYFYIQEESAQYPAQALNPRPGDVVLDMCAAPGGKTTQLAQLMQNQGTLIALEPINRRLKVILNHLERCGVTNTAVFNKDGRQADELFMAFDKILLDAPCSGNFVVDENWLNKRDFAGVETNARLQKQLIRTAISVLKDGGELVYSTCSLEPEENELMLDWMLQEFPDIKLQDIDIPGDPGLTTVFNKQLNPEIKKARRFWPWKTNTQGFFVAKVKKC